MKLRVPKSLNALAHTLGSYPMGRAVLLSRFMCHYNTVNKLLAETYGWDTRSYRSLERFKRLLKLFEMPGLSGDGVTITPEVLAWSYAQRDPQRPLPVEQPARVPKAKPPWTPTFKGTPVVIGEIRAYGSLWTVFSSERPKSCWWRIGVSRPKDGITRKAKFYLLWSGPEDRFSMSSDWIVCMDRFSGLAMPLIELVRDRCMPDYLR